SGPFTQGKAYSLTVTAPTFVFSPVPLPGAQVGAGYAQTVTVSGGTAPYGNFTLSAGPLPPGLTLNSATGQLRGTPTADGTFNFTVSATDSSGGTGPFTQGQAYTLVVTPPTFAFSPASLTGATDAVSYAQNITLSGGTAPYGNFTISAGSLPPGLAISS